VDYPRAHQFAQWLGGQGGALPTTDQWDTAAGRYEDMKGDGPFRGKLDDLKPGEVAVKLKEPMPVGTASKDIVWSDCRDMSGNGLEWTRNYRLVMEPAPGKIGGDGSKVPPKAHVVLRGRDFHEPEPILWDEFPAPELIPFHARERKDPKQLGRIGFRVVIELGAD
jgi:formylglycine-generating enzyme required for sulfatase activity